MEHQQKDGQQAIRRFRIWVEGRLGEGFSEGLAGIEQEDLPAGTVLSGPMLDQSQLHGTLDLLRGLGIGVLRFEVDPPHGLSSNGLADKRDRGHDKEKR